MRQCELRLLVLSQQPATQTEAHLVCALSRCPRLFELRLVRDVGNLAVANDGSATRKRTPYHWRRVLRHTSYVQLMRADFVVFDFWASARFFSAGHWQRTNLVDPASSHMLVSKIKPCMSQYKLLYGETANGSLKQL
jgi:hypothetical protein